MTLIRGTQVTRIITPERRLTYRSSVSSLGNWMTTLETSLKRGLSLTPRQMQMLTKLCQSSDPETQLRTITDLEEKIRLEFLAELRAGASESLSCFVEYMTPDEPPAAHHEWFCEKYEAMERRDIMRACYSCPPGHAKTKFFSRYGPAWYLGKNPNHRYLQGGHSQAFAENEFGKHVRDIIADPRFREVFPNVTISAKSGAAGNWRLTGGRGGYVTKGVGQGIAGYRGHIGGIDDPFGSREDAQSPTIRTKTRNWLWTDFRTRLLPFSPLFIVATRWDPDDLIGAVEALNKQNKGLRWEVYNLPAIVETELEMALDPMGRGMGEPLWPGYYGYDELMELKATLPSGDWYALYKGQPRDIEGTAVKSKWFLRYDVLPSRGGRPSNLHEGGITPNEIKRTTVSVDCANKKTDRAAYTVITTWIEDYHGRHFLADIHREKMEYMEMQLAIENMASRWGANAILVENQGSGVQYINQRAGKAPAPIVKIEVDNKSKEFRFDGVIPMIQAGEVYIPKYAPWLSEYEHEMLSYPNSTYWDQIDSTSQYLAWARKRGNYGTKRLKGGKHR